VVVHHNIPSSGHHPSGFGNLARGDLFEPARSYRPYYAAGGSPAGSKPGERRIEQDRVSSAISPRDATVKTGTAYGVAV